MIASSNNDYGQLIQNEEFRTYWNMLRLVAIARDIHGQLTEDRCYCLKRPGIVGGEYADSNIATITREELIRFSGDMAQQIKDLPDGAQIEFNLLR